MNIRFVRTVLMSPVLLAALGGCASTPRPVVMAPAPAPAPSPVVVAPPATVPQATTTAPAVASDRVVYPEGRWQLYGDGRATPYYWVWIPTGSTLSVAPSSPTTPATSAVVSNSDRTYTFREGRWQLYGDGGATPYYWVWIPSGMTPPAPPIPPQAG